MSAALVGLIAFACVFGGALLGMLLRRILPDEHLGPEARDAIKVAMAMIATLAALVLGLLTAAANGALSDKQMELRTSAAEIVLLDRTLAEFGPETHDVRAALKSVVQARIRAVWPGEASGDVEVAAIGSGASIELVQKMVLALTPKTDAQRWLQSNALQISNTIAQSRWALLEQIGTSIQWPFLAVVVFWLTIIFGSFGLFAPTNLSVTVALGVAALSVAGAIFLILEMDQPYRGLIKIPSAAMMSALSELGKP